jgi:hypothetical protein
MKITKVTLIVMASLEITDQQLEQLVLVYLNKHNTLPGATKLIEHLTQLKEISEELVGFDPDLAQRLTVLRSKDGEGKKYRLRIRHPYLGTLYNVYFIVNLGRVSYYMFLDGEFVDYNNHTMYTSLKSLMTLDLKKGSTNCDENEFTKGFRLKENGRNSPDHVYEFKNFPTWVAQQAVETQMSHN